MTDAAPRAGLRGYVASRPFFGNRAPQHVQNLVIRDHCGRHGAPFKLSAVEYVMPGCFMILDQILDELPALQGLCCYSLFMLPEDRAARARVWQRVLDSGAELHGAIEDIIVRDAASRDRAEDIWRITQMMPPTPARMVPARMVPTSMVPTSMVPAGTGGR